MSEENNNISPEAEEALGKVHDVEISGEMKKRYLDYSMSVLVARALPDVRDGLKPVHRRILYTMHENNLTPSAAYRKCADTVGAVLGRYHPHGDSSVYDAMVRMAQKFSMRYILVDGHGNFGSIDGYSAAAYRYTESRLSKLSMHMLDDIDKNTVDFIPNYDDRLKEPEVLPSRYPQLLVNGSSGIAVGMATNIPPHNLGEVTDAVCALIDDKDLSFEDLISHIKGPDFPTGGIIMGYSGIRAAYATGRGKIVLRARTSIEEMRGGRSKIIVTEIPYGVKKLDIVKNINDLIDEKKIDGLEDVVDLSDKKGIRIEIVVKKDMPAEVVLNHLFKHTNLQVTFGTILLALVDGRPKILTLKEMLQCYIDHQQNIITRRTQFELDKNKARAHILEGYKTAIDFIDEVINIIRSSKTVDDAKVALCERFPLDDIQAQAIVTMQLGKLAGMERQKILDELAEKYAIIKELEAILADTSKILDIVKTELLNIRDKFNDDRRTEITATRGDVDIEDLIPVEDCVITKSRIGYIKRIPADEYSAQSRGGKGIKGMTTRDDDDCDTMFICSSHDDLMLFSNLGRVYKLKAYEIPEGSRTSKGLNIINLISLMEGEKITKIIKVPHSEKTQFINMVTKNGIIKRSYLEDYKNIRRNGLTALKMYENDELSFVAITEGESNLLIATHEGFAIRFAESSIRPIGRTGHGVRAIKLRENDYVIGMAVEEEGKDLLTIGEKGFGRITSFDSYTLQSRGGKGKINYKTEKNGYVAGICTADDNLDIIMMSNNGIIIRTPISAIPKSAGRSSKGVIVMRFKEENDRILQIATVEKAEDPIDAIEPPAENTENSESADTNTEE